MPEEMMVDDEDQPTTSAKYHDFAMVNWNELAKKGKNQSNAVRCLMKKTVRMG